MVDLLFIQICNVTFKQVVFLYNFIRRHSLSSTKLLSPHSSGEEERPEGKLAMCNREIVRRGALILFCDYVVRFLKQCVPFLKQCHELEVYFIYPSFHIT